MFIHFFLINSIKIYRVRHDGATKHIKQNEVKVKVAQSCPILWDTIDLLSPWNSPGQKTGVGCLALLQGILPTQGWNPGLPHCRRILYQLSHKGSPIRIVKLYEEQKEMIIQPPVVTDLLIFNCLLLSLKAL